MNRKQRRAQEKLGGRPSAATGVPPARQLEANRLNDQALQRYGAGAAAEAIALLRQAIAINPGQAMYHNNLGELLRLQGERAAAMDSLDRAIALKADYAEAYSNRGNLLRDMERPDAAMTDYRTALTLRPAYPEAMSNLAAVMIDRHEYTEAAALLRQAIALNPDIAMFHKNLGLALVALGDAEGADAAFRATFAARVKLPGSAPDGGADIQAALGDIARYRGNIEDALLWYDKAWRQNPGNGNAHIRYGTALMVKGDYRQAWPHLAARWSMAEMAVDKRPFTQPFWQGEALPPGGKMLLFTEQGVGETLVLLSLLPELLNRGITPVIECDPRMIPLLQRSFPGLELYPRLNPPAQRLREADLVVQATFFDLAAVFRQTPADCTGVLPLRADMARAAALRAQYLQDHDGPLVGIAWHSKNPNIGAPKSAALTDLAPFLALPGMRFVDLQYGNRAADRAALKAACGTSLLVDPEIDQMKDLDAFAAQVAALDLVISTSNTTAHMAAALGKPTWLLLHKGISPHWYWTLDAEATPWYPTARLLRQSGTGDWRGLAEIVATELKRRFPSATS